jgi:hypothetical protein
VRSIFSVCVLELLKPSTTTDWGATSKVICSHSSGGRNLSSGWWQALTFWSARENLFQAFLYTVAFSWPMAASLYSPHGVFPVCLSSCPLPSFIHSFIHVFRKTGFYHVAQTDLELVILSLQPPKYCVYRCVLPRPAKFPRCKDGNNIRFGPTLL